MAIGALPCFQIDQVCFCVQTDQCVSRPKPVANIAPCITPCCKITFPSSSGSCDRRRRLRARVSKTHLGKKCGVGATRRLRWRSSCAARCTPAAAWLQAPHLLQIVCIHFCTPAGSLSAKTFLNLLEDMARQRASSQLKDILLLKSRFGEESRPP